MLKDPAEYLEAWNRHMVRYGGKGYSRDAPRIARCTNRHLTCGGAAWGWYEIYPLRITVGYWDNETGRDDIPAHTLKDWNIKAAYILNWNKD